VRDIYITDRTVIPPGPDDPPDPTWEGAVPIKGRYRYFMFAYTRGNELPGAGDTEVFGTVYDGAGGKAGVIISAKRM